MVWWKQDGLHPKLLEWKIFWWENKFCFILWLSLVVSSDPATDGIVLVEIDGKGYFVNMTNGSAELAPFNKWFF